MVAWVLYLTAIGSAMGVAGLLSERALQHLGRPVRWVWLWAMVGTIGIPILAAAAGPSPWSGIPAALTAPAVDGVLLAAWFVLSLVLLGNVRLSAWTVRRNERSWRGGRSGEERVLVSRAFGPGVIGAARPRIVLPAWVQEGGPSLERLILAHEKEHVRARDTRLLLAGVVPVLLVPWCLPLWWHLHRLRRAVETDCDARVLAATADPRGYAHALVYGRGPTNPRTPAGGDARAAAGGAGAADPTDHGRRGRALQAGGPVLAHRGRAAGRGAYGPHGAGPAETEPRVRARAGELVRDRRSP